MPAMKKWFARLFWVPLLVVAVFFLVANRQMVAISLDPFSTEAPALTTIAMPLWSWLMMMMFIGFAAGGAGMWFSGRSRRQVARAEHRELKILRKELAAAAMAAPAPAPGAKAGISDPKNDLPLLETSSTS